MSWLSWIFFVKILFKSSSYFLSDKSYLNFIRSSSWLIFWPTKRQLNINKNFIYNFLEKFSLWQVVSAQWKNFLAWLSDDSWLINGLIELLGVPVPSQHVSLFHVKLGSVVVSMRQFFDHQISRIFCNAFVDDYLLEHGIFSLLFCLFYLEPSFFLFLLKYVFLLIRQRDSLSGPVTPSSFTKHVVYLRNRLFN